ncbi:MAG: sulfotransferase [Acidobacteriales bacterium]|nr:sulfotransferase [Terriglobales bacterium]
MILGAPREILEIAAADTNLPADAGLAWHGLTQLHDAAISESDLSPFGELALAGNTLRKLKNWLTLEHLSLDGHAAPRAPTTFIVGLPRTGTTMLHNMMALESGTGYLRHFELTNCWWLLGGESAEHALTDVIMRLDLVDAVEPELRDLHPASALWPDECTLLFEAMFMSYQWPITYGLPGYFDWLDAEDPGPYYSAFSQVVSTIVYPADYHRLLLKSPVHTLHIDQLAMRFPDANFVQIVRPACEIAASWLALLHVAYRMTHCNPMPKSLAQRWLEFLARLALFSIDLSSSGSCLVFSFTELCAEPTNVVRQILANDGRTLAPAHSASIREWALGPESLRRARPRTLEDFGLSRADLPEELFAYDQWFGSRGLGVPK